MGAGNWQGKNAVPLCGTPGADLTGHTLSQYTQTMEGRRIVWDEDKNTENKRKHKVSFETAALVFLDPLRIERRDDSEHNTSGEERRQTLGRVGKLYFVAYTERKAAGREETRIITARTAEKSERKSYHGTDDRNLKGWTKAD
jgi:uncharacterized DUF497 family protein